MTQQQKKFPPIGMSPAVWGPIFWTTMHIVSLGYSTSPSSEEQEAAIKFYESLTTVIPCPICREHYKYFLQQMPVRNAVKTRDDLILWVYNIHNEVNKKLGKPEVTFEQYVANMQSLANQSHIRIPSSTNDTASSALMIGAGVASGALAYYLYTKYINA